MPHKTVFVYLFLLIFSLPGMANEDTTYFVKDTVIVDYRNFDESQLEEYRKQERFNFQRNPSYENNPIRRMLFKLLEWLAEGLGSRNANFIWKLLYYGIILVGVAFLLYFIMRRHGGGFFTRSIRDQEPITAETVDEKSSREDIQQLIDTAIANNEYRVAVRLLYLRSLRALDDKRLIHWSSGKTNFDYIRELKVEDLKNEFIETTRIYEYLWYGEFELEDTEEFDRVRRMFEHLDTKILNHVG